MRCNRSLALLALCVLASPLLAQRDQPQGEFASPGEMDAVIRLCGKPKGISKGISPVTNTLQRNLIYSDTLILHFQPIQGGWGFTTGWDGHVPVTRDQLSTPMPCFRQALAEAASAPIQKPNTDPTIADQTATVPFNNSNFGIPHLYLIFILAGVVLLCILIPTAKQRKRRKANLENRVIRKPDVAGEHLPPRKHIDPDLHQDRPRREP